MPLKPPFPYSVTGAMENWGLVTYRYGEFFSVKIMLIYIFKRFNLYFLISIFIRVWKTGVSKQLKSIGMP